MIDWREVDLGGATPEGLQHVVYDGDGMLLWGLREGRPYAAAVSSEGDVTESLPSWPGRVSGVVQGDGGTVYVIGGSPPLTHPVDDPAEWAEVHAQDPVVTGWVVTGDEDPCNLALGVSGRLYAYEYGGESATPGPWLLPGRSAEELVVAGAVVGLVVAGPMTAGDPDATAGAGGPTAWRYDNEEWEQLTLVDPPDAFTDACPRSEPVLAGHRAGRPRVLSHVGTPLAAPRVELDPAHPQVCVARVDGEGYGSGEPGWSGRLTLAVQAVEGVQLWLQHARGWTMVPGPEGTLRAARVGTRADGTAWLVADGRLWVGDLSAVWDALD